MLNSFSATQKLAIDTARQVIAQNPVYLDTETTGLDRSDEIIEISVIDDSGETLFESLVKPSRPIPEDTMRVHHISNEAVSAASTWPVVWTQVRPVLFGRLIVLYNAEFDLRMISQSHMRYGFPMKDKINSFDLLKLYAQFRGEWDARRGSYRFHSLADAGRQCHISLPNAHRATADTLLTRALLHYIAEYQG